MTYIYLSMLFFIVTFKPLITYHKRNHYRDYSFKHKNEDILYWIFLNFVMAIFFPLTIFTFVTFKISKIILKEK